MPSNAGVIRRIKRWFRDRRIEKSCRAEMAEIARIEDKRSSGDKLEGWEEQKLAYSPFGTMGAHGGGCVAFGHREYKVGERPSPWARERKITPSIDPAKKLDPVSEN